MSDNAITLTGRLCADPVLRSTASGIPVTNMRLAVNPPEGDAEFYDVVAWRRNAEVAAQYLKKGRLVEVTGQMQDRTWTGRDGKERHSPTMQARRVQFVRTQEAREVGS